MRRRAEFAVSAPSAISILPGGGAPFSERQRALCAMPSSIQLMVDIVYSQENCRAEQHRPGTGSRGGLLLATRPDRKSTRLNSSHVAISYAVFCLKKKNIKII